MKYIREIYLGCIGIMLFDVNNKVEAMDFLKVVSEMEHQRSIAAEFENFVNERDFDKANEVWSSASREDRKACIRSVSEYHYPDTQKSFFLISKINEVENWKEESVFTNYIFSSDGLDCFLHRSNRFDEVWSFMPLEIKKTYITNRMYFEKAVFFLSHMSYVERYFGVNMWNDFAFSCRKFLGQTRPDPQFYELIENIWSNLSEKSKYELFLTKSYPFCVESMTNDLITAYSHASENILRDMVEITCKIPFVRILVLYWNSDDPENFVKMLQNKLDKAASDIKQKNWDSFLGLLQDYFDNFNRLFVNEDGKLRLEEIIKICNQTDLNRISKMDETFSDWISENNICWEALSKKEILNICGLESGGQLVDSWPLRSRSLLESFCVLSLFMTNVVRAINAKTSKTSE